MTWGEFLVGTFDGAGFALVDAGPPKPYPVEDGDRFAAPCPEPQGGWIDVDLSMTVETNRRHGGPRRPMRAPGSPTWSNPSTTKYPYS